MPPEVELLKHEPEHFGKCPKCGASPFESFLRGHVQRSLYRFWFWPFGTPRATCAVICRSCKEIVGYE